MCKIKCVMFNKSCIQQTNTFPTKISKNNMDNKKFINKQILKKKSHLPSLA